MLNLLLHHYPILSDTIKLKFTDLYMYIAQAIHQTQVSILSGFIMIAYRVQGLTIKQIIVNLKFCRGTEVPYVMLLKASLLSNILILCLFSPKKVTCFLSKDTRYEKACLKLLNDNTTDLYNENRINALQNNSV